MTGSASPELVAHFRAAVIHKPARPERLNGRRASRRRLQRGYLIRSNRVSIPGECRPGSRRRPKVGGSRLVRVDGESSSREARLSRSVAFKTTDPASSRPSCQRHGSTPASPPGGGQPDTVRPPGAHAHQTQSSPAGPCQRYEPGRQGDDSAVHASTAGRPHRTMTPNYDPVPNPTRPRGHRLVPARSDRSAARTPPPAKGSPSPSSDHPAWLPAPALDPPPATSTKTRSMRTPPPEHRAITIRSCVVPAERHPSVPAVRDTPPSGSARQPKSSQPIQHFDSVKPNAQSVDPAFLARQPAAFKHKPRFIETLDSPLRLVHAERFQAFHRADLPTFHQPLNERPFGLATHRCHQTLVTPKLYPHFVPPQRTDEPLSGRNANRLTPPSSSSRRREDQHPAIDCPTKPESVLTNSIGDPA